MTRRPGLVPYAGAETGPRSIGRTGNFEKADAYWRSVHGENVPISERAFWYYDIMAEDPTFRDWLEALHAADNNRSEPLVNALQSELPISVHVRPLLADLIDRKLLKGKSGAKRT